VPAAAASLVASVDFPDPSVPNQHDRPAGSLPGGFTVGEPVPSRRRSGAPGCARRPDHPRWPPDGAVHRVRMRSGPVARHDRPTAPVLQSGMPTMRRPHRPHVQRRERLSRRWPGFRRVRRAAEASATQSAVRRGDPCFGRSRTLSAVTAGFVARDGWTIEAIRLNGRDCYRVSRHGVYIGRGYCYSVQELEQLLADHGIGLGDFEEGDPECE
jgi:hypothetical protein